MKGCLTLVGIGFAFLFVTGLIGAILNDDAPSSSTARATRSPAQATAIAVGGKKGKEAADAIMAATPQPAIVRVTATPQPTPIPTLSVEQIKAQAGRVTYEQLMRTPEKFQGVPIRFRGEVLQTGTEDPWFAEPYGWLRIQIESEDFSSDAVFVLWNHDNRILTGDSVEVFGLGAGRISYKTVLGAEMTIPQIEGRAVTVISE